MVQRSVQPVRDLLRVLIAPLSSVWLGIGLLATLFIYCSIGSAGVPTSLAIWEPTALYPLREAPLLEMTEYEWFNWWPFYSLIGLVCLNMSVVTIRSIPLTALTAGVWMIHTGIIVLSLGCVIYFATKVEGDVAVERALGPVDGDALDEIDQLANIARPGMPRQHFPGAPGHRE